GFTYLIHLIWSVGGSLEEDDEFLRCFGYYSYIFSYFRAWAGVCYDLYCHKGYYDDRVASRIYYPQSNSYFCDDRGNSLVVDWLNDGSLPTSIIPTILVSNKSAIVFNCACSGTDSVVTKIKAN